MFPIFKRTAAALWVAVVLCLTFAAGAAAYTVVIESDGIGAPSGAAQYEVGDTVTIKAGAAPAGQKFKMWSTVNVGVTFADRFSDSTTFRMPGYNVVVNANFIPTFTDSRNGKTYGVIEVGDRKWMDENLNYQPDVGGGGGTLGVMGMTRRTVINMADYMIGVRLWV